jgi:hypothetical protein
MDTRGTPCCIRCVDKAMVAIETVNRQVAGTVLLACCNRKRDDSLMQTKYIVFQVLALFLLVFIRKIVRFDRDGDTSKTTDAANGATPAAIPEGLPHARRENEPSNHSG